MFQAGEPRRHVAALQEPEIRTLFTLPRLSRSCYFDEACSVVRKYALDDQVFLKFFAKKAIDFSKYKYIGASTCHQYAVDQGLSGLRIISQFNDGEMTFKNNKGYI